MKIYWISAGSANDLPWSWSGDFLEKSAWSSSATSECSLQTRFDTEVPNFFKGTMPCLLYKFRILASGRFDGDFSKLLLSTDGNTLVWHFGTVRNPWFMSNTFFSDFVVFIYILGFLWTYTGKVGVFISIKEYSPWISLSSVGWGRVCTPFGKGDFSISMVVNYGLSFSSKVIFREYIVLFCPLRLSSCSLQSKFLATSIKFLLYGLSWPVLSSSSFMVSKTPLLRVQVYIWSIGNNLFLKSSLSFSFNFGWLGNRWYCGLKSFRSLWWWPKLKFLSFGFNL